ncbi:hypothetical protein [Thermodesulfovibrio hydrogeniphilus]
MDQQTFEKFENKAIESTSGSWRLNINVPRERNSEFRPHVLPEPFILEINIMLQIDRLKQGKWKNPLSVIKSKAYELLQLFNMRFYNETQHS